MGLAPFDWSVIILGGWNPAILTPAGIVKYVFGLPPKERVDVFVALDGRMPCRVNHPDGGYFVMADSEHLSIALLKMTYPVLGEAMAAGVKALSGLPETPVTAAGFNMKYHSEEPLDEVVELVSSEADNLISSAQFGFASRRIMRSLPHGDGTLNLTVTVDENGCNVECNFHRGSTNRDHLIEWLQTRPSEIEETVRRLFDGLKLHIEEVEDADDTK